MYNTNVRKRLMAEVSTPKLTLCIWLQNGEEPYQALLYKACYAQSNPCSPLNNSLLHSSLLSKEFLSKMIMCESLSTIWRSRKLLYSLLSELFNQAVLSLEMTPRSNCWAAMTVLNIWKLVTHPYHLVVYVPVCIWICLFPTSCKCVVWNSPVTLAGAGRWNVWRRVWACGYVPRELVCSAVTGFHGLDSTGGLEDCGC